VNKQKRGQEWQKETEWATATHETGNQGKRQEKKDRDPGGTDRRQGAMVGNRGQRQEESEDREAKDGDGRQERWSGSEDKR
jgi:hypothetical protein